MDGLSPVFSSDRPIEDESVTLVVDTNVLVEFQSLERINWSLLCPRARSVRIVVPATVVREMDKHKRSTGRRRRRAFEFNKLLQVIEDGDGTNSRLQNDVVELSLALMERFARSELEEGKLSFEVADDLIVAEAAKFAKIHADAVFLADDSNARRAAREMGIRVARPVEEWRRVEPRDWRDERIEKLERQVGAMPRLSLRLPDDGEGVVIFESLGEQTAPSEFLKRIGQAILERNPGVDRDQLLRRHNLQNGRSRLNFYFNPMSVTVEQIDRYCEEYQQYREEVVGWSRGLPERLNKIGFVAPVRLEVANDGEAFAEDVEITLSTSKGYGFLKNNLVESFLQMKTEAPEPPTGIEGLTNIPSIFEQQELHRRSPFCFYPRKAPDRDGTMPEISYECARFRHGTSTVLTCSMLRNSDAPSGGELIVRASSASMVDSVMVRYPIRGRPGGVSIDFKSYIGRRLFFFPEDVRDAVGKVLGEY